MDKVFIRGLEIEAIIGVHAWEQRLPRPLRFELELGTDARHAASSDQIRDAIDYAAVIQTLRELVGVSRVALLETLAERIARELFERYAIQSLRLRIDKPGAVSGVAGVGVEIDRRREDYAMCGR
jgi:dihydroneopterin aldolase